MDNKSYISLTAKFTLAFIRRFRVTFLLFFAILLLGWLAYTSFLKREGFPPVEVPVVLVQTPYFVGDINSVDRDVTVPLETIIVQIPEVKEVNSTTTENFSVIVAELDLDVTAEEGQELIKTAVFDADNLPESVAPQYQIFDAGAIDGENDLLFSISSPDKSIEQIQAKAQQVATEIEKDPLISEANVQELLVARTNPLTGQTVEVQDGFNRVGYRNEDGEFVFNNAVAIGVKSKDSTGVKELSDAVRGEIAQLKDKGELDEFRVAYGGDFAVVLDEQIGSLEQNAIAGLIAVVVVLFLFVNWRASIVTAIFIPTVMAATFIGLYAFGFSLNVISLFSLILVLGLFVDDAIVVVEAIDLQKRKGIKGVTAIRQAINDIGAADILGTLTTVLVFAPILFASGVLGDFIRLIPVTVVISLILSLLIALTIIPLLSNILIPTSKPNQVKKRNGLRIIGYYIFSAFGDFILFLSKKVKNFTAWYLSTGLRTAVVILASMVLVVGGAIYAMELKFNIFPTPKDTNEINISLSFPEGTDLATAQDLAVRVENEVVALLGSDLETVDYFTADERSVQMFVSLVDFADRETTSQVYVADLNQMIARIEEVSGKASQSSAGPPSSDFQVAVQVYGNNSENVIKAAREIRNFLNEIELSENNSVTETIIENTQVIAKQNGDRFVEVKAKLSDPNNTSLTLEAIEKIEQEFDTEKLKEYSLGAEALEFDLGQESENLESFNSLAFAGIVAVILIYVVLVLQFNSFLQPFLILLAVPLSFPGLFAGLYFTDNAFSFFSMIGIIGLVGIVVNNTIMLVDFANQAKERGLDSKAAIAEAIGIRFRPLLTTSVTTLAGLLPLALTDPFWEPLAFSIVFGLISSTFLVILAFPAYYQVTEQVRRLKYRFPRLVEAVTG